MQDLLDLVQSLSHGKRTYVSRRLRQESSQGAGAALALFQLACQHPDWRQQAFKARLEAQGQPVKNFSRLKRSLYEQLLRLLQEDQQSVYVRALNRLAQVQTLLEQNLPAQARKHLEAPGEDRSWLDTPPLSLVVFDLQHLCESLQSAEMNKGHRSVINVHRREIDEIDNYGIERRLHLLYRQLNEFLNKYAPVRRYRQALAHFQQTFTIDRALFRQADEHPKPRIQALGHYLAATVALFVDEAPGAALEAVYRGQAVAQSPAWLYELMMPSLCMTAMKIAYYYRERGQTAQAQALFQETVAQQATVLAQLEPEEGMRRYDLWESYYRNHLVGRALFQLPADPATVQAAEAFAEGLLGWGEGTVGRRKGALLAIFLCQYHLYFTGPAAAEAWGERAIQQKAFLQDRVSLYNVVLLLRTLIAVEQEAPEAVSSRMRRWEEFRRQHPEHRFSLEAGLRRLVRQLQRQPAGEPEAALLRTWLPHAEALAARPENEPFRPYFDFPLWLRQRLGRLEAHPADQGGAQARTEFR